MLIQRFQLPYFLCAFYVNKPYFQRYQLPDVILPKGFKEFCLVLEIISHKYHILKFLEPGKF